MMLQQQRQNAMRQQQMNATQQQINGAAVLFVLNMCDYLCQFNATSGNEIDNWRGFVDKHFAPDAELNHVFDSETNTKTFRVMRSSIARYFQSYFESGAQSIRIHTETVKENRQPPTNRLQVTSERATIAILYANGARLEMQGRLTADFTPSLGPEAIQHLEFFTQASEEVIGRDAIHDLLSNWSPTMSNKQSPKMTKKNLPKAQQKMQSQLEGLTINHFPRAPKGSWGGPAKVQTFLEVCNTQEYQNYEPN